MSVFPEKSDRGVVGCARSHPFMHLRIQLPHQGRARRTARPEVLCSPGNPATVSSACAERRPVALRPTLSSGLPLSGCSRFPHASEQEVCHTRGNARGTPRDSLVRGSRTTMSRSNLEGRVLYRAIRHGRICRPGQEYRVQSSVANLRATLRLSHQRQRERPIDWHRLTSPSRMPRRWPYTNI